MARLKRLTTRSRVAAIPLLLLLAGCFTRAADSQPPEVTDLIRSVAFELSIDGAIHMNVRQPEIRMRELSFDDSRFPEGRFFSATYDWVSSDDVEVALLFNFGGYQGEGEYRIGLAGSVQQSTDGVPDLSDVILRYRASDAPESSEQAFDRRLSSCFVSIADDGAAGKLNCERLGDATGKEVSLEAQWRAA